MNTNNPLPPFIKGESNPKIIFGGWKDNLLTIFVKGESSINRESAQFPLIKGGLRGMWC